MTFNVMLSQWQRKMVWFVHFYVCVFTYTSELCFYSFFIWCAVKTLLFSGRVQSNSWGICRNTVITLQLVQALVPLARSLGARMGKAFCLSVATPCVWTVILLFLRIQNNCVTGSMCVGFNLQREVVVICCQNLVLFMPLEEGVCLCFSPDWDAGNTVVLIEQGALLLPMASSDCAHFRAQCGTFSCLKN